MIRNPIEELNAEHRTIERLLNLLERQAGLFEQSGGRPDYDLIQAIADYFLGFPDLCHHPKEDAIVARLLQRAPERAKPLRGLDAKHEELAGLTRRFARLIERVLDEVEVPRAEVLRAIREFIDSQRHHMEMEETHFLPLAKQLLGPDDLEALDQELFSRKDPLVGRKSEARFAALRDAIVNWERESSNT